MPTYFPLTNGRIIPTILHMQRHKPKHLEHQYILHITDRCRWFHLSRDEAKRDETVIFTPNAHISPADSFWEYDMQYKLKYIKQNNIGSRSDGKKRKKTLAVIGWHQGEKTILGIKVRPQPTAPPRTHHLHLIYNYKRTPPASLKVLCTFQRVTFSDCQFMILHQVDDRRINP